MKKCTKCGEEKPLSEFAKDKGGKLGVGSYCKSCKKQADRERRAANPEKEHERNRKWRAANPDKERERARKWKAANPDKERERKRQWRVANLDKARKYHREYMQKWVAADPEKEREYMRQWSAVNHDKVRMKWHNRRTRALTNGGKIKAAEWKALKEFYNYTCLRCGKREPEIKLTLDHVVPLVEGGVNKINNAQCLCLSCNSRKGRNHIDYRPLIYSPA